MENRRIVISWDNGAYIVLGGQASANIECLNELLNQFGPPNEIDYKENKKVIKTLK